MNVSPRSAAGSLGYSPKASPRSYGSPVYPSSSFQATPLLDFQDAIKNGSPFFTLAERIQALFSGRRQGESPPQLKAEDAKALALCLPGAIDASLRIYGSGFSDNWNRALGGFSRVLTLLNNAKADDVTSIFLNLKNLLEALCFERVALSGKPLAHLLSNAEKLSASRPASECRRAFNLQVARNIWDAGDFDGHAISTALCGLQRMESSDESHALLFALAKKIERAGKFSEEHIGRALSGLQRMESNDATDAVLKELAPKILDAEQFTGGNIGKALYGLKRMESSDESRAVLSALAKKIADAGQFTGQQIGMALYGLQLMESSDESRAVLSALAKKIAGAGQFTGQQIGMALYGLQRMESSDATHAVLLALANKIEAARPFTAQAVRMALHGLRRMWSNDATDAVLKKLAEKIPDAGQFDGPIIGDALYGLQWMESSDESHAVLSALAKKIESAGKFDPQAIGMALYGLQRMESSKESRAILSALARKIAGAGRFDSQPIGMALYGLQRMESSEETGEVLIALRNVLPDRMELTLEDLSTERAAVLYFCEALNSLHRHRGLAAAPDLLREMAKRLVDFPDLDVEEPINNPLGQPRWIFEQLHRRQDIDLHGHSHALAAVMVDQALAREGIDRFCIITGRGSHNLANRGQMQKIVTDQVREKGWRVRELPNNEGRLEAYRKADPEKP